MFAKLMDGASKGETLGQHEFCFLLSLSASSSQPRNILFSFLSLLPTYTLSKPAFFSEDRGGNLYVCSPSSEGAQLTSASQRGYSRDGLFLPPQELAAGLAADQDLAPAEMLRKSGSPPLGAGGVGRGGA